MSRIFGNLGPGDGQKLVSGGAAEDVIAGLSAEPKWLSGMYFYDAHGLQLFDKITKSKEYPITREEVALLHDNAAEIATVLASRGPIMELGVGTSTKFRPVLRELVHQNGTVAYYPNDIDPVTLEITAKAVRESHPDIVVTAVAAGFDVALQEFSTRTKSPRTAVFLGGSIGNIEPAEQLGLVEQMSAGADNILIGFDAVREPADMVAAYDDASGFTAAFNRNILVNLNRKLGGQNSVEMFDHRALWNAEKGRMELSLVARADTVLTFDELPDSFQVRAGEAILTQVSYKYRQEDIEALAGLAGLTVAKTWRASGNGFSLCLLHR